MIYYTTGKWNLSIIWKVKGSVFPRAFCLAFPSAVAAFVLCEVFKAGHPIDRNWFMNDDQVKNALHIWGGYNFVLGFLLVFRTQQAYSRFWEGSTLLQEVRGEWFNSVSSLFAFCTSKEERKAEVVQFQHIIVRLMSMLYCCALQTVYRGDSDGDPVNFEIIDPQGLDEESIKYLDDSQEQCEVLVQWIQRLIVNNMGSGILPIPPPVITRAFQELSRGVVHLHNARKIAEIPFPFPYAQMMAALLFVHLLLMPVFAAMMLPQSSWAFFLTYVSVFAFWCIQYIASEIEFPFGNDANDLPIGPMMEDMNTSLLKLLNPLAQVPPAYNGPVTEDGAIIKKLEIVSGHKTTFHGKTKSTRWSWTLTSPSPRDTTGANVHVVRAVPPDHIGVATTRQSHATLKGHVQFEPSDPKQTAESNKILRSATGNTSAAVVAIQAAPAAVTLVDDSKNRPVAKDTSEPKQLVEPNTSIAGTQAAAVVATQVVPAANPEPKEQKMVMGSDSFVKVGTRIDEQMSQILCRLDALAQAMGKQLLSKLDSLEDTFRTEHRNSNSSLSSIMKNTSELKTSLEALPKAAPETSLEALPKAAAEDAGTPSERRKSTRQLVQRKRKAQPARGASTQKISGVLSPRAGDIAMDSTISKASLSTPPAFGNGDTAQGLTMYTSSGDDDEDQHTAPFLRPASQTVSSTATKHDAVRSVRSSAVHRVPSDLFDISADA